MSFIISKLVWAILTPGSLLFIVVAIAWALHRRRPALSRGLLAMATLFLAALLITPIGAWTLRPLEAQFPAAQLDGRPVDGIIVLGGALDPEATQRTGVPVTNDAAERLTTFVALARAHPQARLIISGGSGNPLRPDIREADEVKALFASLGLSPDRVIFERNSRNTYENAVYSKELAKPQAGQNWLLITSAWHMRRSVGCFEKAGWTTIPYPVDYRSYSNDHWGMFSPDQQFDMLTTGAKEWVGLVSYRLMGRV
ncbi:YdcF family protein [Stenotrophobium rhamnosiphilum]|uniref:YdcF family protein n=1 Tax=Stenotrophobium rhamnosiphilum TaxID=2029166 RepID=A0A2T5MDZ2_9GAMM|nr:YdcF family protein [Stenotrophobium rhamnosiphilum]PTU30796.1 YdcF family protein [Stenotrophobium rhamnosiphilum]